ncbi:glycosyltransferase family 4 protein [Candidatus Woesearchaeota archaeon]|nr:glycosyltransferase family 4 protein [Candidatus Woesearchaeota archaeon]
MSHDNPRQKRRVLIVTDNFLPRRDGISRFLSEIIPRLTGRYDITVIAPDFGSSSADNEKGFRLIKMPLSRFKVGDFQIAKPKRKIVREEVAKADLVFSQTIGPIGLSAINAAHRIGKPVVSYTHSIDWELITQSLGIEYFKGHAYSLARGFVRNIYRKIDLLLVPAQSVAELFSWHSIDNPKKVVHLGVDTKKFVPPQRKGDAKKLIGVSDDLFVIGFHGRLGREKDLMTLLRAFIQVKRTNPKTILLVIGGGLESIRRKLESVRGVAVVGTKDNVVPYIQAMDLFCLTSLTETTSLAVLEAMACGVPVITNKVGFVKDYVTERENGMFFTGKNSFSLTRQIQLLMRDSDLRKRLSHNGRKFVEKHFDWDLTAKGILEAIEEALS